MENLLLEAQLPEHPQEEAMLAKLDTIQRLQAAANVTNIIEVFVDDFCAATNNLSREHLEHFSRSMLHGVHSVFPPPQITGHNGEDPVSQKKMAEGEGVWDFQKEILGWILDGAKFTIQLPPKKCEKIAETIKHMIRKSGVPLNEFQKLAGKLGHASFGIVGGKALLSPLYNALHGDPPWIKLTQVIKTTLRDWKAFIRSLAREPTHVTFLVPRKPNYIQYTDACGLGAGGVIVGHTDEFHPIVWQYEWPPEIRAALITDKNPNGTLTINDLELAGMLLGWLVLEIALTDLAYKHVGMFCDNTSAVSWAKKQHTSKSIPAARLLRFMALRQRARKAASILPAHIAGVDNDLADVSSRAFKTGKFFVAHKQLRAYFNHHYPLQGRSWREFYLTKKLTSRVISCLLGKQSPMESLVRLPGIKTSTGATGVPMPQNVAQTLTSTPWTSSHLGFAAWVRTGAYGLGHKVKVQSVTDALAAVSKTIQLANKRSPIYKDETTYIVPLQRCVEGFRREDPPAIPQLALPLKVPEQMFHYGYKNIFATEHDRTLGDLSLIAFYFLLRSGEYTKPKMVKLNGRYVRATRTETFSVKDIGFWKDGKQLSRYSPLSTLLQADSATMKITHQKNGRMGDVVHHETTGEKGAVAALARRVAHILDNGGSDDTPICNYKNEKGKWHSVTQRDMLKGVRAAVQALKLEQQGIDKDIIGNHSLRSGGAMALKLQGFSDTDIMKLGRWKSTT